MTKETLKRAIELDRAIKQTEKWMKELREADTVFRAQKDSGRFMLKIRTDSGMESSVDIPANVAMEAIQSAMAKIFRKHERMSDIFKNLS